MEYRIAREDELAALAVFCWQMHAENVVPTQTCDEFVPHFLEWVRSVASTHTPFVAVADEPVGMAWLARLPRTPRPGPVTRLDGDLQTVYVQPQHRNQGVGEALVRAVLHHAWDQCIDSVTVSSGTRAVPLYQRVGFAVSGKDLRIASPRRV